MVRSSPSARSWPSWPNWEPFNASYSSAQRTGGGKLGLFDVYEAAKSRLLGYRMQGAKTPIYFNSFGYVSGLHNYWQYALTFSFAAYSVEVDRPDDIPTIRQIENEFTQK